jgi:FkbM family methyltransferase
MRNPTGKALAALRFLRQTGPESAIPKRWLFHTGSRLDRQFASDNAIQVAPYGDYNRVVVQGQTFLWPAKADLAPLVQIASELLTPHHPHQYIFGNTKLTPDDVVLDIGACEGGFAALVTSRVKSVIAVEPSIAMCDLMRKLFVLREEKCPVIVNCLLGSEPSVAHFEDNPTNPGGSRISFQATQASYPVPVRTLDNLVEELDQKPTFIKCDAEGAELSIFSGGRNFLRSSRPKLAITTYHNERDYADMYHLLKSLGYKVEGKGLLFAGALRVQMIHAW